MGTCLVVCLDGIFWNLLENLLKNLEILFYVPKAIDSAKTVNTVGPLYLQNFQESKNRSIK
jgi:hypothetical protein